MKGREGKEGGRKSGYAYVSAHRQTHKSENSIGYIRQFHSVHLADITSESVYCTTNGSKRR